MTAVPRERDKQKESRQYAISQLVQQQAIPTQMELMNRLKQAGFEVTQATISRDIREMQIGKSVDASGAVRYTILKNNISQRRFEMIFAETVLSADTSGNIILVKCLTGMANAACEMFDRESAEWGDVVGTLSGDNTFMVLMKSPKEAEALCARLQEYIRLPQQE